MNWLSLIIWVNFGLSKSCKIDELESLNRKSFAIHRIYDKYLLSRIADIYGEMPQFLIDRVSCFFDNFYEPNNFVNHLLAANLSRAAQDLCRFGINTTFGIFGFFDLAKYLGLKNQYLSFERNFARMGMKTKNYIFIPFLGPFTERSLIGYVLESLMLIQPINPFTLFNLLIPEEHRSKVKTGFNLSFFLLYQIHYRNFYKNSLNSLLIIDDPYLSFRKEFQRKFMAETIEFSQTISYEDVLK